MAAFTFRYCTSDIERAGYYNRKVTGEFSDMLIWINIFSS